MWLGFAGAVAAMAIALTLVWLLSLILLKQDLGKAKNKPKFRDIFSKSPAINILSAARMFLFGARDVWFVVALPVFLSQSLGWNHSQTGGFLALWVIGYGMVQALAPRITGKASGKVPDGNAATLWAAALTLLPGMIAVGLMFELDPATVLIIGLMVFGAVFAVNSSLHSYLIVSYAGSDGVSLDVGFYYMSNAMGRLLGTVLSGWVFQLAGQGSSGLQACLWVSLGFLLLATLISVKLPRLSN
jgi:predicted MFS family arabinose efflux permease